MIDIEQEKRLKHITDCKRIETAISRAERSLTEYKEVNGVYENFGQAEYRVIKDKFIDTSDYSNEMNEKRNLLIDFIEWAKWTK